MYAQPTPEPACLSQSACDAIPGTSWISWERIYNLVLERPFDVGSRLQRRPRLVSRVEYTRKPPFTLTYHIRPEARWSDGVPVTARDFIFTLRVLRKVEPAFREQHSAIRRIRAVDAKTFRLVLRPRYADWPSYFGNILPSHALRGRDLTKVWIDRIDNPRTGAPIGSGPFLVERWERGKQLVLRRNPNYWGPHPAYLDRLVLRFGVDPHSMDDSIRRGELVVACGFPPDRVSEFRRVPGVRVHSTRRNSALTFCGSVLARVATPRCATSASTSARLRHRPGRDRAGDLRRGRSAGPADPTAPSTLLRTAATRPNWKGYRLRRDVSRRLLGQAGCTRGADGIYTCAGKRLSLRLLTMAGRADRARAVELVQAQLRQVGIEAVPTFLPSAALFDPNSHSTGVSSTSPSSVSCSNLEAKRLLPRAVRMWFRCGAAQLLPAAGHARPRPGGAHSRPGAAGARLQPRRRSTREGRACDPAPPVAPRRGAALDGARLRPLGDSHPAPRCGELVARQRP